jgi:hypothetical protein
MRQLKEILVSFLLDFELASMQIDHSDPEDGNGNARRIRDHIGSELRELDDTLTSIS